MNMRRMLSACSVLSVVITLSTSAQTTYHVDDDAPPGGDGTSWATAFRYVQDALHLAQAGDQIHVATGRYTPDCDEAGVVTPGDDEATFHLINGVALLGGYAGLADPDNPGHRDVECHMSMLCGELRDAGDPPSQGPSNDAAHSLHVVTGSGTDRSAVIDGFTITGGRSGSDGGGGMLNVQGSPTVIMCVFVDNSAGRGGGMCNLDTSCPEVTNCTFLRNRAWYNFSGGGGMYNASGSCPILTTCRFESNVCDTWNGAGGGMHNREGSDATLINCSFIRNRVEQTDPNGRGGAMYNDNSDPLMANCAFADNDAMRTGGITLQASDATLQNCTLTRNNGEYGGAINIIGGSPTMTNCAIIDNAAQFDPGVLVSGSSAPRLANCIIWGNKDLSRNSVDEIAQLNISQGAAPFVTHCCIQGLDTPSTAGNIGDDPRLTADQLHLLPDSPCINAGDPDSLSLWSVDRDGEPRVADACVDIGPDEFNDMDNDALQDWYEERYFGTPTNGDPHTDADQDGDSNLEEYGDATDPTVPRRTYYVHPAGDDTWDGLAMHWDGQHGPKATIRAAMDATYAQEQDEIVVAAATYTGPGNTNLNPQGNRMIIRAAGGPGTTVIDCEGQARGFCFLSGESEQTVLSGLTIINGFDMDDACGVAAPGSAVYVQSGSPTLVDCTVAHGSSQYEWGAAVFAETYSAPTFLRCTFTENSPRGMYAGGDARLTACTFLRNGSTTGGAMRVSGRPALTRCAFVGNRGDDGAGLSGGSPVVTSCLFADNMAEHAGGAAYHYVGHPTYVNCSFLNNYAQIGGALYISQGAGTLDNCIVWGNHSADDQIATGNDALLAVTYSCVQGGWAGEGNIDVDPLVIPDMWHLQPDSPCIDQGDPAGDYSGSWDADEEPRVTGGLADIGPDEWRDTDEDDLPDFWEHLHFGSATAAEPGDDDDGDGIINLHEYAAGRDPLHTPTVIHVDDDAPPEGDGTSWATAFRCLQDALHGAVDGDAIRVAAGYYTPNLCETTGMHVEASEATFLLHTSVALLGGYAGLADPQNPDHRDIRQHITILSGDLTGDDLPNFAKHDENVHHVLTATGTDLTTVVDGFTIAGGNASGATALASYGGGVLVDNGCLEIRRCTLANNAASAGAGVYCHGGDVTISGCVARDNAAESTGGAIGCQNGNVHVHHTTFSGNNATNGSAVACGSDGDPFPSQVLITNCAIDTDQGAISNGDESTVVVRNSCMPGGWDGVDNIDADPMLTLDGLHLRAGSPCIDAADPEGASLVVSDIDGEPRVIGSAPDIGADEWLDTDVDGLPDHWEHSHYGSATMAQAHADDDNDGVVNLSEYAGARDPRHEPIVYHVDNDASPGGDGASWATAMRHLQDALRLASDGDEIRVAGGTYFPDRDEAGCITPGDPRATFVPANGATIIGGYAGLADPGDGDTRDVLHHETILSGDLAGDDVPLPWTFATPQEASRLENTTHVMTGSRLDSHTLLRGCTITSGTAYGAADTSRGGGLWLSSTHATIDDCTIAADWGQYGAGLYMRHSRPTIKRCSFNSNRAKWQGGAMYSQHTQGTISNSTFHLNQALGELAEIRDGQGGALFGSAAAPVFANCTFAGNYANKGAAVFADENSIATLTNCILADLWMFPSLVLVGPYAVSYSMSLIAPVEGIGNIAAEPLFVSWGGVDLFDLAILQVCFTGMDDLAVDPACTPADADLDGDVDLDDYAAMLERQNR